MKSLKELQEEMKKVLNESRYMHVLSVRDEICALSDIFDVRNKDSLLRAALLHDCTKYWSVEEHLRFAEKNGLVLCESDLKSPPVLHSKTGALKAMTDFGEGTEVYNIISSHTTGKQDMTLEEKLLFLADYIEKTRTYVSCVEVRDAFYRDLQEAKDSKEKLCALDRAVLSALKYTVLYLEKNNLFVHPDTICAIEYLGEL